MRIIMLNHYEKMSPRVLLVAKLLQEAGHTLKAVMWCRDSETSDCHGKEEGGVPLLWVDVQSQKGSAFIVLAFPSLYWEIWDLLKSESFDVIHCNHFLLLPLAVFIKWRKNVALVYDSYERYAADIADYYFRFGKKIVHWIIEKVENRLRSGIVKTVQLKKSVASKMELNTLLRQTLVMIRL